MQREIEAAGIATIILSNIPDLTASVGVPRIAAIEYPFGRTLGMPGDHDGQMAVLRATLGVLARMETPGSIEHLPFTWPEPPAKARSHPTEPPPIAQYLRTHPWDLPRLMARDVPRQ